MSMIHRWLIPVALAGGAASAQPELTVHKAEFFSELPTVEGFIQSVPTTAIPFEPQTSCYRWVLKVEPARRLIPLREVFTLPAPAKSWGGVDGDPESPTTLTPDRAGATTQLLDSIEDGELSNGWCVAEGDPQGLYAIAVYGGERLLHRFEFTVGR